MKRHASSALSRLSPLVTRSLKRKLILCYHRFSAPGYRDLFHSPVSTVPLQELEKQLSWLKEFADFVPLEEIQSSETLHPTPFNKISKPANKKRWQIAITIDDGYRDVIDLALPIFNAFEVPVSWFITTRPVADQHWIPWWDLSAWLANQTAGNIQIHSEHVNARFDISNRDDRQKLQNHLQFLALQVGHSATEQVTQQIIEQTDLAGNAYCRAQDLHSALKKHELLLAPHTHHHSNLSLMSPEAQRQEIGDSRTHLKQWGITPLNWFAYPFGKPWARTTETPKLVRDLGFENALTTQMGYIDKHSTAFELPRISVDGRWNIRDFRSRVLFGPLAQSIKRFKL